MNKEVKDEIIETATEQTETATEQTQAGELKKKNKLKYNSNGNRALFILGTALLLLVICGWGLLGNIRQLEQKQEQRSQTQINSKQAQTEIQDGTSQTEIDGNIKVDLDILAKSLLENVEYETGLEKVSDTVAMGMVSVQEQSKLQLYLGSGTLADMVLLCESQSEQESAVDLEAVQSYLSDTRKSFADYLPGEAEKINQVVLYRQGKYIIACVTEDIEGAKKVIKENFPA